MRALFALLVAVQLAATAALADAKAAPPAQPPPTATAPTATAPTVTAPIDHSGYQSVLLAPRAGKVVLVSFWASWCAPCLAELPGLVKLRRKLAKHGVDIVFVNTDPPGSDKQVIDTLAKRSIALDTTYLVSDEDPQPFIDAVDPSWAGQVPYHVLYGRDGVRLKSLSGERPLAELELAVVAALDAKALPPPQ